MDLLRVKFQVQLHLERPLGPFLMLGMELPVMQIKRLLLRHLQITKVYGVMVVKALTFIGLLAATTHPIFITRTMPTLMMVIPQHFSSRLMRVR